MAFPNIFLIIMLPVSFVFIVLAVLIFVIKFSSPLDWNQACLAVLPKITVVVSLSFAGCILLFLPFDVQNQVGDGGLGEVTAIIWQVIFSAVNLLVLIIIPYMIVYYESAATDRPIWKQHLCALITVSIIGVFAAIIIIATYFVFGYAQIPVTSFSSTTTYYDDALSAANACTHNNCGDVIYSSFEIQMSFFIYVTGLVSLVGWLAFVLCGGCGMTAMPIECILKFVRKPKRITPEQYKAGQKELAKRTTVLIKVGEKIDQMKASSTIANPKQLRMYRDFKLAVYEVEKDHQMLEKAFKEGGGSWILPIFSLIGGIFSIIVSITWTLHIILYMIVPNGFIIMPFLNTMIKGLHFVFPPLGVAAYAFFAFYLLIATIVGNITIWSKIPCITVYPLKYRDTMMNSFLVNTAVILLASITIAHFCANAFSSYAAYTTIDKIFNTQIKYMKYLTYFFQYIHYVLLGCILLGIPATLVFSFCIREKKDEREKKLAALIRG